LHRFAAISLVAVLSLSGCAAVAVSRISDFGGQRDIQLVGGLKSDVWLAPKSLDFGVPFIFHYYGAAKPFGLRLQIWDASRRYQTVEINETVVNYDDGEVIRNVDIWSRPLKPYTQHNSSSSGGIQTEMFMLSDEIEELVLRHADLKITLKGNLITTDGERIPFEASESFHAESRSDVKFWDMGAGC
jgi:hypothetical protein